MSDDLTELIRRINEGMRRIAQARREAGVKPGEPLLGLNLAPQEQEADR